MKEVRHFYVSGPYSADTEEKKRDNIHSASFWAQQLVAAGIPVFCPHLQSQDWEHKTSMTYPQFLLVDVYWVIRCDCLLMLPGWKKSPGALIEHAIAKALNMPIYYVGEHSTKPPIVISGMTNKRYELDELYKIA